MSNILKIDIDDNRIYGLDILRCLAILFVVVGHGNLLLPKSISQYIEIIVFDGVSIFFVLSGYLIGGIFTKNLEKQGASFRSLFNFWKRRWYRTLPNYFLILIILTALSLIFADNITVRGINRYFFFSQNLYYAHPSWFFPEAWSLSVEEWFYLLIPIFIFGLAMLKVFNNKGSILFTALSILVVVTAFRMYRFYSMSEIGVNDWDLLFRKQVFTRLDSLMYGVIGAYIAFYRKELWLRYKLPLFLLGISILLFSQFSTPRLGFVMYTYVFSFSVNSLATLFLLPLLSDLSKGKGLLFKIVTYISLTSYSMYLIHLSLIQNWILKNIDMSSLAELGTILKYCIYWILTIVMSILIYKYYEVPMTKLRDKFAIKRR
ncbi:MAG: acyltransferase [Bacteroidota bacterium]